MRAIRLRSSFVETRVGDAGAKEFAHSPWLSPECGGFHDDPAAMPPEQHQQEADRRAADVREVGNTAAEEGKSGDAGKQVEGDYARNKELRGDRHRHEHQ